jgi:phosphatidylserine/phosphatidylglycerophosphate/cardiolipin synthase-like enzyme
VIVSPARRQLAVLEVIRGARTRLGMSLFRCDDPLVFGALRDAVARGVAVDVLVTSRSKGRKKLERLWDALEPTGATLHAFSDPVVKYHAKYLVADNGPAVVASLNFTRKCFTRTLDAMVVTHDPAVVHGLQQVLAADSAGHAMSGGTAVERLIVGPERARAQFAGLVEAARVSIQIIDPKFSDPAFMALLDKRRAQGIRVDVCRAPRIGKFKAHGRFLLIDGELAVVGGLSFNAPSLDFHREVAIVVRDPRAVAVLRRVFRMAGIGAVQERRRAAVPSNVARVRSTKTRFAARS